MDWNKYYNTYDTEGLNIILNPIFITGIVVLISFFSVWFLLKKEENITIKQIGIVFNPKNYGKLIFIVGIIASYIVGLLEVMYQSEYYIKNYSSEISIPIVYHLLFSVILFYFLHKKGTNIGYNIASIIAIINVVLFAVLFSRTSFGENQEYIETSIPQRIAFYMHYISLAIIIYFMYMLYKMYNNKNLGSFFKNIIETKIVVWIFAFFIIFIASTEVMLHGLVIGSSSVTSTEIASYKKLYKGSVITNDLVREDISYTKIESLKTTILKTSFPVLWGIIAFILLGVLVLVISFVYQKIKVLVVDDKKPEEEKLENTSNINQEIKTDNSNEDI